MARLTSGDRGLDQATVAPQVLMRRPGELAGAQWLTLIRAAEHCQAIGLGGYIFYVNWKFRGRSRETASNHLQEGGGEKGNAVAQLSVG